MLLDRHSARRREAKYGDRRVRVVPAGTAAIPALGTASSWTGQVFGFFGEAEGGMSPLRLKLLDAFSLHQALEPKPAVVVPK